MVKVVVMVVGLMIGAAALASAQDAEAAPSPFFDCPYINYFDNDCPQLRQLWEEQEQRRLEAEGRARQEPVPMLEEAEEGELEVDARHDVQRHGEPHRSAQEPGQEEDRPQ